MTEKTWHEEQLGVCPHGFAARPYCATCVLEDDEAKREEKERTRDAERIKKIAPATHR
jgi:hypothetical protein